MATHGLARFPQILTEEDVVRHYYSGEEPVAEAVEAADTEPPPAEPEPAPEPEPEPEPAPEPTPDPEPAPSEPPADPGPAAIPTADELESKHTKAELVAMAEQAGLDASGTKADIAGRLAAHYSAV